MTNIINVPANLQQRILKLVGLMDSTLLGNDTYYCLRIVDIFVNWLGEDWVKTEMQKDGFDWDKKKQEIERMNKIVQKVKPLYDILEDKKFSKMDKELAKKRAFIAYSSRVPLFNNPATFMYVWFVKKTNLQNMKVRAEDYKVIEDTGFRKMEVKKSKETDVAPQSS